MSRRIASASADPKRRVLTIAWRDGTRTTKDMSTSVQRREPFAALRDPNAFRRVKVLDGGYAVGWPGLGIDFAADALWYEAHPKQLPFADEIMTAKDFRTWMMQHGFSLSSAAQVLGLARRSVAYYASGGRRIPRVVFLACMAIAAARRKALVAA
jgi:hypothetical protein